MKIDGITGGFLVFLVSLFGSIIVGLLWQDATAGLAMFFLFMGIGFYVSIITRDYGEN